MQVKVLKTFIDLSEGKERKVGEIFECSDERYEEIKKKLPEWVECATIVNPAPAKTSTTKTASKAKTTSKKQGK